MKPRTQADRRGHGRTKIEDAVLRHAREHPQDGQAAAARALARSGLGISPAGVRYIWRRHGLETTYKRLCAIDLAAGGAAQLSAAQREIVRRGEATRRLVRRAQRTADDADTMAPDERRNQILLAAAELFARHGFAGTSVRDIAERVGLLPGSVYHHFPAKQDILLAVNREGLRQLTARVRQAIDTARGARAQFEAACAVHVDAVVAGNPIARVTATALFAIHDDALQRRLQHDREAYERLFRELIDALDLPPDLDRSVFRLSLFGALNWTRVWYRPGGMTAQRIARQIAAVFCGRGA